MKLPLLPRFSSLKTFFQHPLALIGGLLFCVVPVGAQAQSVTFTGTQTTLPASVSDPLGVAVDNGGNVFITDETNDGRAVELPRTATGYGPQAILPASGQLDQGVAVDSAGDVFITEATFPSLVLELPRTATGYGPQAALPASGFGLDGPEGVAVDSAGNVFITDSSNKRVVELPRTATGYGPQTTLPFSGLNGPHGVAVDNGGNVFITVTFPSLVLELPKTATGYGPQATLPTSGLAGPNGVAVDTAGNIFIVDESNNRVVELPRTATGYGPQTTLPASGLSFPNGVAVDGVGDIFITDEGSNRVLELETHSVNFGSENVCPSGQTTPAPCSETLTLNFNINADVTLGTTPQVLTGGAPNLDFTLASGSTCTGAFSAGATCTVNVTFTPMAVGTRNGSVEITDGSGNVITTTLVSGYGAPLIMAQFSPNPLDFGTIPFGSTSTLPLTVTNIGQTSFTLTPLINGPSYKITGSTCGAGITAGNSCALQVEFTPYVVGTHNDTLTLQTNGLTNPTVALDGLATGIGSELEVPLEFGTIPFGTTKTLLLTITNVGLPGRVTFTAKSNGPSYKVLTTEHQQNTCLVGIVAGQRCTLPIQFDPVDVGKHNDILTLTPSGAATSTVSLQGFAD